VFKMGRRMIFTYCFTKRSDILDVTITVHPLLFINNRRVSKHCLTVPHCPLCISLCLPVSTHNSSQIYIEVEFSQHIFEKP